MNTSHAYGKRLLAIIKFCEELAETKRPMTVTDLAEIVRIAKGMRDRNDNRTGY